MINSTWKTARKIVVTTGLMSALLFSTACGGSNTDAATPAPEPESTVSASASSSESPTASSSPVATKEANANTIGGIPVKEGTVSDGRGEYRQTTITDDDPAMKYDSAKATEIAKSSFTPEELATVQKQSIKFLAEEGLDSTANGGGDAEFKDWWSKNEGKFHPIQKDVIYANEMADPQNRAVIVTSPWRAGKYDYDYSEGVRIQDRKITVTSIDAGSAPDGQPFVTVRADVSFKSPIIVEGKPSAEAVTGQTSYTWLKDTDGKFKIAGYKSTYNAVETVR